LVETNLRGGINSSLNIDNLLKHPNQNINPHVHTSIVTLKYQLSQQLIDYIRYIQFNTFTNLYQLII